MPFSDQDRAHIENAVFLRALPEGLRARIVSTGNQVSLAKGETLFRQGERADAFFLQLQGQVKLLRAGSGGEEAVLHVFGPGDTYAEAVMFMGGAFPASAVAVTAARILAIPAADLRERIRENAEVAFAVLASFSQHMKVLVDQVESLKMLNGEDRIVKFILKHAPSKSGAARFDLPYEKSLIARELGMKHETFSRALNTLRLYGVSVEGRTIHVASLERLQYKLTELS